MKVTWSKMLTLLGIVCVLHACDTKGDFEEHGEHYFLRYYGEDNNQEAVGMVLNDDGTLMILAKTEGSSGSTRMLLIKVDPKGHILWQKKYGGLNENPTDIEKDVDGNLMILTNMYLGIDVTSNEPIYDFKVLNVSTDGTRLDSTVFGNNNGIWKTQWAYSITPLRDGGFAVTGNSTDESIATDLLPVDPSAPDQEDLFAIGFSSSGAVTWTLTEFTQEPTPGSTGEHIGSGIKVLQMDGNQLFLGTYSDRLRPGNDRYESNFQSFTFTSNGIYTAYGSAGENSTDEEMADACLAPSILGGGFFEFGTSFTSATSSKLYFCKRGNNLGVQDEGEIRNMTGNLTAVSVSPAIISEGFLLVSNEKTAAGTSIRLSLIKNKDGWEQEWSANFGSVDRESVGTAALELPDGRIFLLGTIELETQRKIALFKLNASGQLLN